MNLHRIFLLLSLSLGMVASRGDDSAPTAPTLESLQREVAELKENQRQLAELVDLLRKKSESGGKPDIMPPNPDRPTVITQNVRGEPFRGETNARVAVVEYSDFNCSHCARYATNIFPRLEKEYILTGKIRYLFRDLPDRQDLDSQIKAQMARCAGEQGKFWEMHDRFFRETLPVLDHPEVLVDHARALGLDPVVLNTCIQSRRYLPAIERIGKDARRVGMYGTPSFLMGELSADGNILRGTKILTGGESYEELKAALDELLKQ